MGAHLRVQVPLRARHSEQSEGQLREDDRKWTELGANWPDVAISHEALWAVVGRSSMSFSRFPHQSTAGLPESVKALCRTVGARALGPSVGSLASDKTVWRVGQSRYCASKVFIQCSVDVSRSLSAVLSLCVMRLAMFLPNSTPHWSNGLIPQRTLCTKTLCS